MAQDLAWRQIETPDREDPTGPLCFICGEELTIKDLDFGAEVNANEFPEFGGDQWVPICIKCSKLQD